MKLLTETSKKGQIEIQRLQNQLDASKKVADTKAEALEGIGNDLAQQRQKQETAEKSLKEKIVLLTEQKEEVCQIIVDEVFVSLFADTTHAHTHMHAHAYFCPHTHTRT